MKKKRNKDEILTIPNGLSFLRLLLIPLIVWLYCGEKEYGVTTVVIAVSSLTDIIDGKIARKFNMVSDVGKVLDPIADKLTQAALVICLLSRYPWMGALLILFIIKESLMLLWGYLALRYTHTVNSAKWYGKLSTAALYAVMMILILFMDIPELGAKILTALCGTVMVLSLVMYGHFYHSSFVQVSSDSGLKKALNIGRKVVFALIWVGMITLCIVNRKKLTAEGIASFTPNNPWFAAIFMLFLFALKSLSIVIFSGMLYAANGILFPFPVAVALNLAGTIIMVSLPYEIGKKAGSSMVDDIRTKYPQTGAIQELRSEKDYLFSFLVRMIRLPSDVVSLYMGAVNVDYKQYLLGSVLGLLPHLITYPIMGMSIQNIWSPAFFISACVEVAYILLTMTIYSFYRKRKIQSAGYENRYLASRGVPL